MIGKQLVSWYASPDLFSYAAVAIMRMIISLPNSALWIILRVTFCSLTRMNFCEQVTHNPDLECYADRVIYLQDGRIVK